MQLTPSSPNKKGKHFLKTTQPNNLPKAEKMPPRKQRRISKEPKLHKLADKLTEILIYFMIIFSPWAFGTTEPWSIWTMNITAYALGILLVTKWITRLATKYKPNPKPDVNELSPKQNRLRLTQKTCTILLAGSMFLLLAYILTSAINARGNFNLEMKVYTYIEGVNTKYPHSYDATGTWMIYWQYLGFIILFWSTKDWISGTTEKTAKYSINYRLKKLIFIISFNGGVIAFESIIQRLYYNSDFGKLLFAINPSINKLNDTQFGPFAYRSNAASYFNIIWPIAMGMILQLIRIKIDIRNKRFGNGAEYMLIPFIILMASCPIISSSRGGAIISLILVFCIMLILFLTKLNYKYLSFLLILSIPAILISYLLGGEQLFNRFHSVLTDNLSNRYQTYDKTINLIGDYVLSSNPPSPYGSGPGSFQTIFQFEIDENLKIWESWVHCDYLEFYLTFGIPGSIIILLILFSAILHYLIYSLTNRSDVLFYLIIISIIGVMIHALADFPLQTYSTCLLVVIISSIAYQKSSY